MHGRVASVHGVEQEANVSCSLAAHGLLHRDGREYVVRVRIENRMGAKDDRRGRLLDQPPKLLHESVPGAPAAAVLEFWSKVARTQRRAREDLLTGDLETLGRPIVHLAKLAIGIHEIYTSTLRYVPQLGDRQTVPDAQARVPPGCLGARKYGGEVGRTLLARGDRGHPRVAPGIDAEAGDLGVIGVWRDDENVLPVDPRRLEEHQRRVATPAQQG